MTWTSGALSHPECANASCAPSGDHAGESSNVQSGGVVSVAAPVRIVFGPTDGALSNATRVDEAQTGTMSKGVASLFEKMSRPELVRTSPRRPCTVAILFPSGDQAAKVAATEKRSAPRSSTTWMRPSYGPVANNPAVDHPTGWPPLETFHTRIPVGVYASTAPPVATVTSPPSGDHAGWKSVAARATARGGRPFPASQSVTVFEAAPPVVHASVRPSGVQAISTGYWQ